MKSYVLTHISDQVLLRELGALIGQERGTTATILAHIAEVDHRRLYVPAACPSMHEYCVRVLGFSDDSAAKRIQAARTARRLPLIFQALAEGRLHLTAVNLLAPYLTQTNAAELLAAAAQKTKLEILSLLAERFPRPDVPTRIRVVVSPPPAVLPTQQHAPAHVDSNPAPRDALGEREAPASAPIETLLPGPVEAATPRPKVTPLAPKRFALQLTMPQSLHDKLRHAQELLSHQNPHGDVVEILEQALDLLIRQAEKRRFAATSKPRSGRCASTRGTRHVPAHVKREVWKRDGGQCTFVSATGDRCSSRRFLEFDHVDPVARGGRATVARMQLRCRAHNQYEAERTFGTEFMRHKRKEAQRKAAQAARRPRRDRAEWPCKQGTRLDRERVGITDTPRSP